MTFESFQNKISDNFKSHLNINLSEKQIKNFYTFMDMLIEKNKVMNLTAITDPEEIIIRHFVDSCMLIKFMNLSNLSVVDIGTGAGFPGLPLTIIADTDSSRFVLTDSLGKRVDFIRDVINAINLQNAVAIHIRAEGFCHDAAYRESFDLALSRGVAKLSVLAEYSLPALKVGGTMVAYKMDDIESELNESQNAIKILGGKFHLKHSYDLIPNEPTRSLIEIQKFSKTPNQYPRKAGTPSKNPL